MSFVHTTPPEAATGAVADLYERLSAAGPLPNWARLFSLNPALLAGWSALLEAVKARQDPRRYDATLGAARAIRSSYCLLAHGSVLLKDGLPAEALREIGAEGDSEALSPAERAILAYAAKIATDATSVTQGDIDGLRQLGLMEEEIFDIAATAAARCFFSKLLDALGTLPDATYAGMEESLRRALTVGRPIAG
ncbi:carboxymuconolactone decarboxylase family protein [Albidovulum sediminicola]|uniref:Carboxymuconolactone decarboxylase family protein n=1 Tax=Albidovulum sediminicola TaxID=2984331 RepID=A0ABT2Z5R2_9RHOB|nr:carboxymuconolactone decarboxylase family protein [Defluviimonas sp. WL0075]MCV2866469.1 carboxymuconolactone decarboxylase family protein [Defluviimonas sp. WL0075]